MKARNNPFRTDRVLSVRYRLQGTTWDDLLRDLAALDYRAALVGPDGSGKTTLLEDLEPRLTERGFSIKRLCLNDASPVLPEEVVRTCLEDLGKRHIILFDGADLMDRLAWHRFKRCSHAGGGLLVTSHRPGLLPTLIRCRTTPALLETVVSDILGSTQIPGLPAMPPLFDKHGGNLRNAIRELYDICAT